MSDADKTEKTEAPLAEPKKKSKLVPILCRCLCAARRRWRRRVLDVFAPRRPGTRGRAEATQVRAVVDMEVFVVNLADESGNRFLRVNMRLLTWDEEQAAELKEDAVINARVRSAILELLSLQYADALVTPEGKEELKKAIAERATETVGERTEGDRCPLRRIRCPVTPTSCRSMTLCATSTCCSGRPRSRCATACT